MNFNFKPVTLSDWQLLLEWRNDPSTRESSLSSETIEKEEHLNWLKKSLESKARRIYIAQQNNNDVGTVRLDRVQDGWELSWTLAPKFRGQGMGKQMVKSATLLTKETLVARVKPENQASCKIAEYAGFSTSSKSSEMICFILQR